MKILIIDDDAGIRKSFEIVLKYDKHNVISASNAEEGLKAAEKQKPDLIFLDMKLPDKEGLEIVPHIKKADPGIFIVIITGHANVIDSVKAIKGGVYDYIEKPISEDKLRFILHHVQKEKKYISIISDAISRTETFELIGTSEPINKIRNNLVTVSDSDAAVLITGENGTGKEIVANLIHKNSKKSPLVTVNCSAIPEELIESEFFGHKAGSFTGAISDKIGKVEHANNGTLFLDEIGDMSLRMQSKLLRVIQYRTFTPVGDAHEKVVNVRFIAATNKDLKREIQNGNFREDLFFRLNEVPMHIPPLRERKNDIPILLDHIKSTFSEDKQPEFTPEAMEFLMRYSFPGNVRELKNFVKRLILLSDGKKIDGTLLYEILPELRTRETQESAPSTYSEYMDHYERKYILKALEDTNWNISKTAELINMQRSNLYKKIQKYDLKK